MSLLRKKNSWETANDTPGSGEVLRLQTDRIRARRDREVLGDLVSGSIGPQNSRGGGLLPERRLRRRERQLQQGPARSYLLQVRVLLYPLSPSLGARFFFLSSLIVIVAVYLARSRLARSEMSQLRAFLQFRRYSRVKKLRLRTMYV